jgi:hypothetical protein
MTIVAMFSFVLISGVGSRGDFADWFSNLVGGRRSSGPEVGQVYGKKVTYKELRDLAQQRQMANFYMSAATSAARDKRMEELRPSGNQPMTQDFLQRMFSDPEIIQLQQRANMQPYFGGSFGGEGLFDFLIWLHQADTLRIPQFTKADINQEIRRLTLTTPSSKKFDEKVSGNIEAVLRRQFRGAFSPEGLLAALNNEFRVRMAQIAVLGLEPTTLSRMPAPITPEEFWVFYKDNQTKIDVRLLPVKVEDYVAQVTEKPTEKDLKDLYDKYKNDEYRPEAKDPGFKQPRRVQVEWVSGRSDSEFYTQAAKNFRPMMEAVSAVSAGFGSPGGLLAVQPVCLDDTIVAAGLDDIGRPMTINLEYDNTKWKLYQAPSYTRVWRQKFFRDELPYPIHDVHVNKAQNVAAAVGLCMNADPLTAYPTFLGNATLREMEARGRRGTDWVLSGFQPGPVMSAAVAAYLTPKEEYLPLSQVREQVEQRLLKALAQGILVSNLRAVQKEVEAKGKITDKDKKELRDYLAKVVQEYNLQTGKTTEPRDQNKNKIADDPGLKQFREAYLHPAPVGDPQGKGFPQLFFSDVKPFVPERFPRSRFGGDDDLDWRSGPESFLFWKTDDQPPRTLPLTDPEVKREVERAWRLQKARELAKKDADRLAAEATKEARGDDRALRDFAMKHLKKEPITLPTMSRFMRQSSAMMAMPRYEPPQVSEDKVAYAGPEFATKVLALKDKAKGDALVQPDQPETAYYVAVLVDKSEPNMEDFLRTYRSCASDSVHRDPLLQIFEQERQVKYYKDVLEQLRQEAKLDIKKDKLDQFKGAIAEE